MGTCNTLRTTETYTVRGRKTEIEEKRTFKKHAD